MSEEEKDRVVHEYDGIEEYDNQLPRWWLYSLYATVIFAAVYWFAYHSGSFAESPHQAYQTELAQKAKETGTVSPELLSAAKLGVLCASTLAAVLGLLAGRLMLKPCAPNVAQPYCIDQ